MGTYSETALIKVTFNGGTGLGSVSVPGVKVGDVVLAIHHGSGTWDTTTFRPYVGTDDTFVQADPTDYSAITFTAVVARCP